jgi:cytochrome c-type biogenesis protein CcmF
MIAELGLFALILAFLISVAQSILPMLGASNGNHAMMEFAKSAAISQFLLVGIAFASLTYCYVVSDFSVLNVAQNSHSDKPLFYKITGVWGNHEGSMVLWQLILTLYGAIVAIFGGNIAETLRARALAVQSMVSSGLLLFIITVSSPFERLDPVPLNGSGLNPILQDPGLAFHPPVLYTGYVGFSMVFSFAIAALIEGKVDAIWAKYVRPWVLLAWCFLTMGIIGGSWWAYYTLGWGGWWYWDPTENVSLLPWITGTALLHSMTIVEKRETTKPWVIFLAIITFSLSLIGTFLVRSGILTSVHSFATDPARGVFILALLTIIIGSSFILYAIRAHHLKGDCDFEPISREGGLLFGNVFLSAAAATVFLGTLYPVFADAMGLGTFSIGPPYYNKTFAPLMIPVVLAMPIVAIMAWKKGNLKRALKNLGIPALISVVVFGLVAAFSHDRDGFFWAALGLSLAAWVIIGMLFGMAQRIHLFKDDIPSALNRAMNLPASYYGMMIAHIGIGILIIGAISSTLWKIEKIQVMQIGEQIQVGKFDVTLKGVEDNIQGPNYIYTKGIFEVEAGNKNLGTMYPERRRYIQPVQETTIPAIRSRLQGVLYVVLSEPDERGGYITRIYYDPLVLWVFIGAGCFALGGFVSMVRRRSKSPKKQKNELRSKHAS